ncbi:hypothetical protein P7K49_018866 [Saguinus oedipus]|uniref:Uncharacterized protein n=1 Tax=Saguinus oedipus TaxID=9490 RepID=A0ABQ9V761_SAGOE|nr:hypothetical protein P7K49_018866 [Saguinus oedipus]
MAAVNCAGDMVMGRPDRPKGHRRLLGCSGCSAPTEDRSSPGAKAGGVQGLLSCQVLLHQKHSPGSRSSPGHLRHPMEWSSAGVDPRASHHIFHTGSRCRCGRKRAGDAWSDQCWRQNNPFSHEPMSSRLTPTSGRTGSWEQAADTVSSFYDVTRNRHGIVSVGGAKATVTSTIAPITTFPKMPQKSGQGPMAEPAWCLRQLTTFAEKFQELKEAAEMPTDKAREKTETWSHAPSSAAAPSVKGGDEKASQPLQPTRTGSLRRTHRDRPDAERGHRAGAEAAAAAPEESHAPWTTALQEAAASAELGRGLDTNTEEEKNTQPKRRKEELEAELREQETELKGLRKQSEIPPQLLSERLCRQEAPGGRERMKTRKTEVAP